MCRADVGGSILRRSLDHVNIRNASCIVISARGLSHESGVNESNLRSAAMADAGGKGKWGMFNMCALRETWL